MTEKQMQNWLIEAIYQLMEDQGGHSGEVLTFEEAGVMTKNAGLVVYFHNGCEFQLKIVRSKEPKAK